MRPKPAGTRPDGSYSKGRFLPSKRLLGSPVSKSPSQNLSSSKTHFKTPSKNYSSNLLGDRQPRTIPTKDPPHEVVFWGGWCANCRNLRKRQNTHHIQFCTRDVDRQVYGGGAWISRSDLLEGPLENLLRTLLRRRVVV